VSRRHWFTPNTPDVLGMLEAQAALTLEGVRALLAWAEGDPSAAEAVRDAEHRADDCKRTLRIALTEAFLTPLEPEDIFELSRGLDDIVNSAKHTVGEAELMEAGPDAAIAEMSGALVAGVDRLGAAFAALSAGATESATGAADEAVASQRRLERSYRGAMSALVGSDDLREVTARRELYRRISRTGDHVVGVAERVWYAVLKQR